MANAVPKLRTMSSEACVNGGDAPRSVAVADAKQLGDRTLPDQVPGAASASALPTRNVIPMTPATRLALLPFTMEQRRASKLAAVGDRGGDDPAYEVPVVAHEIVQDKNGPDTSPRE